MSYGKAYDSSVQGRDKNGNITDKKSVAARVNNDTSGLTIVGGLGVSVFIPKGAVGGEVVGHSVGDRPPEETARIKAEMDRANGVSPNTRFLAATNAGAARRARGIETARRQEAERIALRDQYEESNPEAKAARLAEQKRQKDLIREARLARFAEPVAAAAAVPTPVVAVESLLNSRRNLAFNGNIFHLTVPSEAELLRSIRSINARFECLRFHLKVGDLKIPSTHTLGYLLANSTPESKIEIVEDLSEIPEPSPALTSLLKKLFPVSAN